jgi:DNA-directed RNA polymerase specialized sigma54-like protein
LRYDKKPINPRATAKCSLNKVLMETPIGTIKIQDLFSANVGNHASKSIQHRIIQIIQNENVALSDQKICDLLTRDKVVICRCLRLLGD